MFVEFGCYQKTIISYLYDFNYVNKRCQKCHMISVIIKNAMQRCMQINFSKLNIK